VGMIEERVVVYRLDHSSGGGEALATHHRGSGNFM
jgi:hypothetical protein